MIQYSLDEIDVTKFKTIKDRQKWYDNQDHSRWVFYDETAKIKRSEYYENGKIKEQESY